MPKPVRTLIVVSDIHAGCRVGLHPPDPTRVDGGGFYSPSDFQQKMWDYWREFWDQWVPSVTRREPYDIPDGGDVWSIEDYTKRHKCRTATLLVEA